jgi:hypothetical protein
LKPLLAAALERARAVFGVHPGEAEFRGLAVEADQAGRALAAQRAFDDPAVGAARERWVRTAEADPLYRRLGADPELSGLTVADFGIVLLALAPEDDPDYERLFGFLQDDVTQRRASVELAVELLGAPGPGPGAGPGPGHGADRADVLARFADGAPLTAARVIELVEPDERRPGLLGAGVRADPQFVRWLLGVPGLDPRLAGFARLAETDPIVGVPPGAVSFRVRRELGALFPVPAGPPVRLHLYGPDARLRGITGDVLARRAGGQRLIVDPVRFAAAPAPAESARLLAREARWFGRVLYIDGGEAFAAPERHRAWAELTARFVGPGAPRHVILAGTRPTPNPSPYPVGFVSVELPPPDVEARVGIWEGAARGRIGAAQAHELAHRYTLTWSQIETAVGTAAAAARAHPAERPDGPTFEDFAAAARVQGGHELEALTHKIVPRVTLDDLVVAPDVRAQLDEVVGRVTNRSWVLEEWGFGRGPAHGYGVNALFAGPSGTGKTMAAEGLAAAIKKDLFKIDLTAVVSKYIGETEQKLEQIFLAGEATQAVLFFDEADSLLGKRSDVKDAHDRYANLEVSYLLQRMERYDGLIILATNLLGNIDDAFLRRMSAIVRFAAPRPVERRRLWDRVWPPEAPVLGRVWPPALDPGDRPKYAVDPNVLGEQFDLTGGNIRNAALSAAFAAAARPWFPFVSMWDVLQGVRREYQKHGQAVTDADLGLNRYAAPPPRPAAGAAVPEADKPVEATVR